MKNLILQSQFINHNKKNFKFKKNLKSKILIEFNSWAPLHIANSYLLKCLQEKFDASIVGYAGYALNATTLNRNTYEKIKWHLGSYFSLKNFGIYKSMGCENFIWPNYKNNKKINNYYNHYIKSIRNKRDLENLKIKNIWVGDLIYDSFIKYKKLPTIDVSSEDFKNYFKGFIEVFCFWEDYFNSNKIKAVITSHSVYLLALPSRIAIANNIKSYVCHAEYLYSLNKKNFSAREDFINAKNNLKQINTRILKLGISSAKKRLKMRLSGKKAVDIWWAKKTSFGRIKNTRVLNKNNKYKFLIATHSFLDSPHVYGKHLFTDFYEWLNFLGKISNLSDSEWYLKIHPYEADFEKGFSKSIIENLLKKYPKIKLIPANTTHNQIVKEGINCVLTVIGTVALEYAVMNIPVITASKRNPYVKFNFNIHANSIKNYKNLLLNPNKIKVDINKTEIYKFYFHMNILNTRNWLFDDYPAMERKIGSQYNISIYEFWIKKEFNFTKHQKILSNIHKFIDSNDYRLGYKYIERNIEEDIKLYEKKNLE